MYNFLILLCSLAGLSQSLPPNSSSAATIVSIPPELTYLLPDNFQGNTNYTFVNGTTSSSSKINNVLHSAKQAPIISYDQSFLDIVGSNPQVKLIEQRPKGHSFAFEMGVWVPERNSVWFTSAVSGNRVPAALYELDLETEAVSLVSTKQSLIDPNGGYYYQGKVYIATYPNNETYSGGVVAVDVKTLEVEMITNSYFGLRYNGIDDMAWGFKGNNSYMYFTDLNYAIHAYKTGLPPLQLPAAVYRYDPQTLTVLPIISRNDLNPNGIRISPDMRTLYVTDSTSIYNPGYLYSPASGPADTFWLGPYVYAYTLDDDMMPTSRRLFAQVRQGIADGIHVDDDGNVWTGEYEGAVVRNPAGRTIGVFNSQFFQAEKEAGSQVPFANFALAGDTLVYLCNTRLWTVKLGKTVVRSDSSVVN